MRRGLGLTIRDGFGQTASSTQVGNAPGQDLKIGSMGRPMPGFEIALVDPVSDAVADEARSAWCSTASSRADGRSPRRRRTQRRGLRGRRYHTGDVAGRDADGYVTYVGRADDVFKASHYRISPFELESVLIEHPAVAEGAVVPAPDEVRLAVPMAYVVLVGGQQPSASSPAASSRSAASTSRRTSASGASNSLMRTVGCPRRSGAKIRRVELREAEAARQGRSDTEYREDDFG